jgi:ubiquinol oxidase
MPADATLRDVVLVVRADEANHRDVNHYFADEYEKGTPLQPLGSANTSHDEQNKP